MEVGAIITADDWSAAAEAVGAEEIVDDEAKEDNDDDGIMAGWG